MKGLELAIYLLFALAAFFAFGMYLYSAIALLIAFLLVDRVKKYDKEKAKKLNYIGIGIVVLVIVLYLITAFLAYTLLSGLFNTRTSGVTNTPPPINPYGHWQQINSSYPRSNSSLQQPSMYYNSSDKTFYCSINNESSCSAMIVSCTNSRLKIYGINFQYGSYSELIIITNEGQTCKIDYNVTDANVTKEIQLNDVSMTCNLPLVNGEIPSGFSPTEYCQFHEVLLTP